MTGDSSLGPVLTDADGKVYFNSWHLMFDQDARCSAFVEWYMASPVDHQ